MRTCSLYAFKATPLFAALLLAVLTHGDVQAATGDRLDRSKLKMTFEEDFSSPLSLWDPRSGAGRWKTCYWFGWQPQGKGCVDRSSRTIDTDGSQYVLVDAAYNKVDPFRQSDGQLAIVAAKNAHPEDPKTGGRPYTAGMITTEPSFSQQYGYFEIETQLAAGAGLWPAFWMLPADHAVPFELDVMENHGRDTNAIYCTAHWGDKTEASFPVKIDGVQKQRTYGALWTSDDIVWYVDDVEVARTRNKDLHSPMYLIAGMGVGGTWGGYPDPNTKFPAEMVVDYIRAYQIER